MKRAALLLALLAAFPVLLLAQDKGKVIDVRAAQAPAGNSFAALWASFQAAQARSDTEGAQAVMKEIRRLRIERNIRSLEDVALARVSEGLRRLRDGNRADAEEAFAGAVALDPYLPDAHYGLALAQFQRSPLGMLAAVKETAAGLVARLPTARGRDLLLNLLVPVGLLALFVTVSAVSLAFLLRHGTLLLHDIEEWMGPERPRSLAIALFLAVILLPLLLMQGWGWLPLWWLIVLFVYLGPVEMGVALLALLSAMLVGPAAQGIESRIAAYENPLYRASLVAVEQGPDSRAIADLEQANREHGDDRDLAYLLALEYKKAGRYDDAAALYRELLRTQASDPVALNNLGNLEFAAGEFPTAIVRYKQALEANPPPSLRATLYYNLSLAQYQKFEYQPAQESRSQADRLDAALVHNYDALWKYDSGLAAVVDIALSEEALGAKFAGVRRGTALKNVALGTAPPADKSLLPALTNRFSLIPLLLLLVVPAMARFRGKRAFTMRCSKCGTPFCKKCHLGAATEGLCTQCHHLFVVRDGVSGPARNQKLLEVQKEEERRERVYRGLSLLAPGAGHLYARKTIAGLLLVTAWAAIVCTAFLAGRLLPVTEASSALTTPWGLWLAGFLLLVLYFAANRAKPDFDVVLMTARRGAAASPPRRAKAS